jgi:undecaprenyl-diphosphatase
MKKINFKSLYISLCFLTAFLVWTILIVAVEVNPIGPNNSAVGLSSINERVKNIIGVNFALYEITDWLGLIPIFTALCFAVTGLIQWIKRKSLFKVDKSLIVLGAFYLAVIAVYFLFEKVVINYRPVLIGGNLEPSYPSSTTMLVTCIMPTALMQLRERVKNKKTSLVLTILIIVFIVFMIVGRIISGVHWFSDIIGGVLLSIGLVLLYRAFVETT